MEMRLRCGIVYLVGQRGRALLDCNVRKLNPLSLACLSIIISKSSTQERHFFRADRSRLMVMQS